MQLKDIRALVASDLAAVDAEIRRQLASDVVLVTTGSAAQTGLVAAFELAPYVAVKALAGPLVDRIGQRRVSVVADLASAIVIVAIPLLHSLDALGLRVRLADLVQWLDAHLRDLQEQS